MSGFRMQINCVDRLHAVTPTYTKNAQRTHSSIDTTYDVTYYKER